jgi:phage tail sheath protein FI
MPFQLSPGVAVVEKDFTSIVPAVSTAAGGFAGVFQWGPCLQPVTINSENDLVRRFGKPSDANFNAFFTSANFLSYTNNLLVVRTDTLAHRNAVAIVSSTLQSVIMTNVGSGYTSVPTVTFSAPQIAGGITATGTALLSGGGVTAATIGNQGSGYISALVTFSAPQVTGGVTATGTATIVGGAITAIAITNAGSGYTTAPTVTITSASGVGATVGVVTIQASTIVGIATTSGGTGYTSAPSITFTGGGGAGAAATASIQLGGVKILNENDYLATWSAGSGVNGEWAAKYPGTLGNSIKVSMCGNTSAFATWEYKAEFDSAPGTSDYAASVSGSNDELHVIIIDNDGRWTGQPGAVLEKFAYVSKASDAKRADGTNNYYKDVINGRSEYIWWTDFPLNTGGTAPVTDWGTLANGNAFDDCGNKTYILAGGADALTATDGQLMTAWDIFRDDSRYDVSLLPLGKASTTVANFVIAIAEERKDCMVFASPQDVSTGEIIQNSQYETGAIDKIIAYRNALPSTSYAALDSGFKYQYDRYNDKYRYIALNGDVAGLCARTDYTNDPWFSPGGLNRGQIKNVVKLAVHLHKTDRDNLYKAGVNPVVNFPGEGTVLFGDKTLLAKPSAFDRINVRRLFIVLEKAVATAAKFQLFEFNDGFTRAQFRNLVEPFLRDVQGRRGITDFVVKCDDSNNTGEVIDRNEFVADIFIKPNRSINFITLNFVAARSGINFSEIGA